MIRLSASKNFRCKENLAPERWSKKLGKMSNAWALSEFRNATMPPHLIIKHVTAGNAICIAALKGKWRTSAEFISAQIMGIDVDESPGVDALLEDRFVREQAFLVYPTPSHTDAAPRSRILFALDSAISDPAHYVRLLKRLMHRFNVPVDESCKDVVRIFYGSLHAGYRVNVDARLSLATLEALDGHPDELKPPPLERQETAILNYDTRKRSEKYALATKQGVIDKALSVPAGHGERHSAFNDAVLTLIPKSHWAGLENVEGDLRWLGAQMGREDDEIDRSIRGAKAKGQIDPLVLAERVNGNGKHHEPIVLEPPDFPPLPDDIQPPDADVSQAPTTTPAPTWRTSDEAMQRYRERLTTAQADRPAPLVMPFRCLWHYGGAARILDVGLLVGVVGMSGGMKTSFCECLTEPWRQVGANDIVWWGTEWSWEKMADRAVQRHGGAPKDQMLLHELWLSEEQRAVPFQQRFGVKMSQELVARSAHVSQIIESWAGKSHQLEESITDVEMLLDLSARRIDELRRAQRNARVCVWDYAQLLDLYSARNEGERITSVLGKLKLFCIDQQINGVVASQVTKSSSYSAKNGDEVLEAESGQFFRSDKFNLVITLKPVFKERLMTDRGVINVAKNSDGQTGIETVYIDPSRFMWKDKLVPKSERVTAEQIDDVEF